MSGHPHDCEATTDVLAQPTSNCTSPILDWMIRKSLVVGKETIEKDARNGTTVPDYRRDHRVMPREPFAHLQISGVEVLRAVGQKTESGHQQHDIDTPQPMVLEHLPNLMEEDACSRLGRFLNFGFLLSSSAEEDFALGEKCSKHSCEGRDTGGGPE